MNTIELLAPAGTKESFLAAISAGANAIYFGLQDFNARARAKNIDNSELAKLIKIAHQNNVKAYLTLNVIVYSDEFENIFQLVDFAKNCGIDAVIVQDLGVVQFLKENFPSLELHASTQLTTHNLEQCKLLADLGFSQVNLCRELSLQEIKPLCEYLNSRNVVTEVFVHGAFCISFSGQCYFSDGLYALKGNRGECVQPCRRTYKSQNQNQMQTQNQMQAQNQMQTQNQSDFCTPFNLKDNCLFENLNELYKIGVKSLKIEGRIKNPQYVWAVTSAYREQLDKVYKNQSLQKTDFRLTSSMNRMFTNNYLTGNISKSMFTYGPKDHSLEFLGFVDSFYADKKILTFTPIEKPIGNLIVKNNADKIRLSEIQAAEVSTITSHTKTQAENAILSKNDEITILTKNGDFVCTGLATSETNILNGKMQFSMQITGKLAEHIQKGNKIYRIPCIITEKELQDKANVLLESVHTEEPLTIQAKGRLGEPLELSFICSKNKVTVKSSSLLESSNNKGLNQEILYEKLGKLGNTDFYLQDLDISKLEPNLFLPLSELNALRRNAVEKLGGEQMLSAERANNAHADKIVRANHVPSSGELKHNTTGEFFTFATNTFSPNPHTTEKAFIFSDIQKATKALQTVADTKMLSPVILELPLSPTNEHLSFFKQFPFVIPMFQAILFDNDFKVACDFLDALKPICSHHFAMVENAGFANFASKNGFCIIPGFQLNIANNKSLNFFANTFNAKAIVASSELSEMQLQSLQSPSHTEIWIPDNKTKLLMQSRKCLLCKITNCTKDKTDSDCIKNCNKTVNIKGLQDEKIFAIKKSGFYSRLYKLEKNPAIQNPANHEPANQNICKTQKPFPTDCVTRQIVYIL